MDGKKEQDERKRVFELTRSSEARAMYEKLLAKWDKKLKLLIDANRESQRITAEDLAIIVY